MILAQMNELYNGPETIEEKDLREALERVFESPEYKAMEEKVKERNRNSYFKLP